MTVGTALCWTLIGSALAQSKPEFARPPYAGAYDPQGVDERGLWMQFDEGERVLRDSPFVVRDPRLQDYVRSILCKAVGFDRCQATRLYLVRDDSFNASMAPNGVMHVHLGLLARLHSEAELALVLAHEFAHFELRHGLNGFRNRRRGSDVIAWISLAGVATNQSTSAMQNGVVVGLFSFSRAQESAADLLAAAYIRASPYNLRASAPWRRVLEEDEALRSERKLRNIRRYYPYVTDTHPTNLQRIAYFTVLKNEAVAAGAVGDDGAEAYRDATDAIVSDLFAGLIKSNEFGAVDYVIRARGDTLGWNGRLLTLRAELYRFRALPRDIATAREFFEKATGYRDAPAEAWRGIGLTALRLGETETGRSALAEYLKRAPRANDAGAIRMLLEN
jgi:hypothetical protein